MKNLVAIILLIIAGVLGYAAINQFTMLQKAHSTFENYYAFRECKQLIKKADTFGLCKLASGETIKIVEFNNKWYLNNDLPFCINKFCL